MDSYIYKPILEEKRISLILPDTIIKNTPYYFRNDSEIKNAITEFIIPNSFSVFNSPNADGLPFTTYIDYKNSERIRPLGVEALKFYICIAEVSENNKFLFYNMPVAAFVNGHITPLQDQQSLPIQVKARIDLGKSYIFSPQSIDFESTRRTFNMMLRFRSK